MTARVDEAHLQLMLEELIAAGELYDSITGWDLAERAEAQATSPLFEPLLALDEIVRTRAARSALLIRDRLTDLRPVSTSSQSISLDSSDRLFVDLLYANPSEGTLVLFELKRARAATRQATTELLAYAHEARNHLPFAGSADICLVVVATEYPALLDHSLQSLLAWTRTNVLALLATVTSDGLELSVHLPMSWTTLGHAHVDARYIDTWTLSFEPNEPLGADDTLALVTTALELTGREGERNGSCGLGLAWVDSLYPAVAAAPIALTVGRVNPARFISDEKADIFLGNLNSPLRAALTHWRSEWWPAPHELSKARAYLEAYGQTTTEDSGSWWAWRADRRHLRTRCSSTIARRS